MWILCVSNVSCLVSLAFFDSSIQYHCFCASSYNSQINVYLSYPSFKSAWGPKVEAACVACDEFVEKVAELTSLFIEGGAEPDT